MSTPVVWIAQEPMRKDSAGRWVSKGLDIASAAEYGNPIIIWGPDASRLSRALMEAEANSVAAKYNENADYVVGLGSPTHISILAWAIGKQGKLLRILEWDRGTQRYYPTLGDTVQQVINRKE